MNICHKKIQHVNTFLTQTLMLTSVHAFMKPTKGEERSLKPIDKTI